ncbi:GDP-D-mannose dehydratase [Candidatus Nitromaritima sp. SCGC AAA799-A02]|nr:GDP-D-mannose dehydratase [Candidatus Nitromaritima sp. SCGC AAA799-A02]KMP11230.1 GDP-D-mannose dehydratase [Candidatus Nitromaritima sp. SCGC AAA799-C22]
MTTKKALITGITGQDGSYLAEFLLEKGYEVHGLVRRASTFNRGRIEHLRQQGSGSTNRMELHYGDLQDFQSIDNLVATIRPHEIYNLAAQSHVGISFKTSEYTCQVNAMGTLRILHSLVANGLNETCRFYQASTSEMFGKIMETPQTEETPFYPRSPYGISKVYAHWTTINYREAFDVFACNGIMFNHESPRRGENFVSRKITLSLADILAGKQDKLYLGNLNAKRDWGFAKDYVEGMWLVLQQDAPEDFLFSTGIQYSVRDFVQEAFGLCGFDLEWSGSGVDEVGIDKISKRTLIEVDPSFFRPAEVDSLIGNSKKANEKLNWHPKTSFKDLVYLMVESDLKANGLAPDKFIKSYEMKG